MTTIPPLRPFAIGDPLPSGLTVLEASAGTGKTFAITALAVRYLAEGRAPDDLLLITFTKAATGELRGRLRAMLREARDALGRDPAPDDGDLIACLRQGSAATVAARAEALAAALTGFDAITVATTHSFCSQVLRGVGIAADVDTGASLETDIDLLVDQVIDDIYIAEFAAGSGPPAFEHKVARAVGRAAAMTGQDVTLPPYPDPPVTAADRRVAFGARVRDEVERRKRAAGVMTYDDLQERLCDVLMGPGGVQVAEGLARRFPIVLIDEFQDTDPVQYRIVHQGFIARGATVVMIGDPKQAIYGFRGADVHTYLRAARGAGDRRSMDTSWRSDADLLRALDAVFGHARLGHPEIAYRPLAPAPVPLAPPPAGIPDRAALRFRVIDRSGFAARHMSKGGKTILADPARRAVVADLAADIVRLLAECPEVSPRHIAVLVRSRFQGLLVRRVLREAGVPTVINRVGSVFDTLVAAHWLRLLEAIERPSSRTAVAAAAVTLFCGWDGMRAADADDIAWEGLHELIAEWGTVLRRHGVAAMLAAISSQMALVPRVLARPDGERELTDLRHIAELLNAAADELPSGGLTTWLAEQIRTAAGDTDNEERTRRLDSDAGAVQVVTIHGAKGLEFPVVYCPFLWEPPPKLSKSESGPFPLVHTDGGARRLALGGPGSVGYDDDWERYRDEQRGEDLRLMYVALTRARHQLVVWWAARTNVSDSPLARLLFAQAPDGSVALTSGAVRDDAAVAEALRERAALAPRAIAVEWGPTPGSRREPSVRVPADALECATLNRAPDAAWRRWSYSGITAAGHDPASRATGEVRVAAADETDTPPSVSDVPPDVQQASPLPLAAMPAGADVGSLVHEALERADFAAPDLGAELAAALTAALPRHRVAIGDAEEIGAALATSLATPLGPAFDDLTLSGLARRDRIDELGFELPVAADAPLGVTVDVARLGEIVARFVPPADPMAAYAGALGRSAIGGVGLRGFLSGFIDLVVRMPDGGFAVIDYKTNRLGAPDRPPTAWDYRPEAITAAMHEADYPLQAMLYLVAVHRLLRARVPGYDADRDLRGAAYLFVRGMTGAATPRWAGVPGGVWTWRPPAGLVAALSDAFDEVGR